MDTNPFEAVSLRLAAPDDLESIGALEALAADTPWSMAALTEELRRDSSINAVAVDGQGVVRAFIFSAAASDELSIHYVVTHPDFRRRGIASMLIRAIVDIAVKAGARSIFLEVRSKNRAARALYAACGFIEQSVRKKYYADDNDDAIVMTLCAR